MARPAAVLVVMVSAGAGCDLPYELSVSVGGTTVPDVAVFADDVQISDGTVSVPVTREFDSYEGATAAAPIELTLHRGGVLQQTISVGAGDFCDGLPLGTPPRESFSFPIHEEAGSVYLGPPSQECIDVHGDGYYRIP